MRITIAGQQIDLKSQRFVYQVVPEKLSQPKFGWEGIRQSWFGLEIDALRNPQFC